jgi:hypothetical protein
MPLDATIREKVEGYVKEQKLYTSVDIANAIKRDGIWVRTREVRDWLRANISDTILFQDYTTSTIDVCSGAAQATLYHPTTKDPLEYTERDQVSLTPDEVKAIQKSKVGQPVPSAVPDINSVLTQTDDGEDSAVIRTTERIKIPGHIIKKLGWHPGNRVDPAVIKTHTTLPSNLKVSKDYRVSIPRSCVNWPGCPVKVILKNGMIVFDKA